MAHPTGAPSNLFQVLTDWTDILKHTSCPTVLTENFFMDTKDDCKLIFSGSGRQRVADMHVAAIVRCIEYHNNK